MLISGELTLRYGVNPQQAPARVSMSGGGALPFQVLNGAPGYINLLDALNAWQLVKELRAATGLAAAASFKHVSPAGAAVGVPLSETLKRAYQLEPDAELSPLAAAYARARGADRVASFGDLVALSDTVDKSTAQLLRREVSDGVIAPGFSDEALAILRKKQGGKYLLIQMDSGYEPPESETREVYGVTFEQRRNDSNLTLDLLQNRPTANKDIPEDALRDLLVALVTLKYTQSNSICLALDGQAIGVGAGQQSRILCTRLASSKADLWRLRQHPAALELPFKEGLGRTERDNAIDGFLRDDLTGPEQTAWLQNFSTPPMRLTHDEKRDWIGGMTGVSLGSDAFIPFRDNIDRAAASGVTFVVQPGGSLRDDGVIAACDEYGMAMAFCGVRLFHH